MAKKKPAPKKSALDPRGDKSKAGIGKKRKSSQVGKSQNPPKYKKTSSQTRTAKTPPKTTKTSKSPPIKAQKKTSQKKTPSKKVANKPKTTPKSSPRNFSGSANKNIMRRGKGAAIVAAGAAVLGLGAKFIDKYNTQTVPLKSPVKTSEAERLKREKKHRDDVKLYSSPLEKGHVPAKRNPAKVKLGPKPKGAYTSDYKAPQSDARKKAMENFKKHNKTGSKLGMKMDDILRGAFSFMGAMPKSTDEAAWKRKSK